MAILSISLIVFIAIHRNQLIKTSNYNSYNSLQDWVEFITAVDEIFTANVVECLNKKPDNPAICYVAFFVFSDFGFKVIRSGMPVYYTNKEYHIDNTTPTILNMPWNSVGDQKKCFLELESDKKIFTKYANQGLRWFSKVLVKKENPKLFACLQAVRDFANIDGWLVSLTTDNKHNLIWGTGIAVRYNFFNDCDDACRTRLEDLILEYDRQLICLLHTYHLGEFETTTLEKNRCEKTS